MSPESPNYDAWMTWQSLAMLGGTMLILLGFAGWRWWKDRRENGR